uniref:Uncharacterized protein n=1 Tax=Arundo donax TaxID=35708 RepID=A0A0A9CS68_ARUDO
MCFWFCPDLIRDYKLGLISAGSRRHTKEVKVVTKNLLRSEIHFCHDFELHIAKLVDLLCPCVESLLGQSIWIGTSQILIKFNLCPMLTP